MERVVVKVFVVGELLTNCYLFIDDATGKTVLIDPGGNADRSDGFIEKNELELGMILNTHCHFDHVGENAFFKAKYRVPLAIGELDIACLRRAHIDSALFQIDIKRSPEPDMLLKDGNTIEVGNSKFLVLHTPGHTPGSVCFYEPAEKILFSGDTLFFESVGRWDLPGGDYFSLMKSVHKLLHLPPETVVYPGHGETTTIEHEREFNPFLK